MLMKYYNEECKGNNYLCDGDPKIEFEKGNNPA